MKALRIVWLVLVVGSSLFAGRDVFGRVYRVYSADNDSSRGFKEEVLEYNERIEHNVPFPIPSNYTINMQVPTACTNLEHKTETFKETILPQASRTGIIIDVGYTDLPKWYMRVWATSLRDMHIGNNEIEIDDGLTTSPYLLDKSADGSVTVKRYFLNGPLITPDTKVIRVEMCPRDYYAPWGTIKYFSPTERVCIFYIAYIKGPGAGTICKK